VLGGVGWAGDDVWESEVSVESLRPELSLPGARFVLAGMDPDADRAIGVAYDLILAGLDTPATGEVAGVASPGHFQPPVRDDEVVDRHIRLVQRRTVAPPGELRGAA
jgi:hypothetical protein